MTNIDPLSRQADITGRAQRIEPLSVQSFDEPARTLVAEIRETLVKNATADIPEFFGVMLKHPDIFRRQIEISMTLLGAGSISARDRELAILRVGWLCGAPYEWGEHVWVSKKCGVTDEEVIRVPLGSTDLGWSYTDTAILAAVEELISDQMISDNTWGKLSNYWSEKQLIEFITVVGQYYSMAILQNSLRVRLASTNKGLQER